MATEEQITDLTTRFDTFLTRFDTFLTRYDILEQHVEQLKNEIQRLTKEMEDLADFRDNFRKFPLEGEGHYQGGSSRRIKSGATLGEFDEQNIRRPAYKG